VVKISNRLSVRRSPYKYYFHSMRTASPLHRSVIFMEIIAGYSEAKSKPNSVGEMPHYLALTYVVNVATSATV
jgi:hypothetical protein